MPKPVRKPLAAVTPARFEAFTVLMEVERGQAYADDLLRSPRISALSPQDRNLCTTLVLGTLRWQIALDARVRVREISTARGAGIFDRLAIRPYPQELEQRVEWQGQPLLLRPIKPEDGEAYITFFSALEPDDVRFRMFISMRACINCSP